MSPIGFPVHQYAYMVNDLEAACRQWTKMVGAGPFFIIEHHPAEHTKYRGQPSTADISYAFGQAGPSHIQFIVQHNEAPSVYRDMYAPGEQGLHHIGAFVEDFDAHKKFYEEQGFEAVTEMVASARVAYMDTRPALGCFVELYEDNPGVQGLLTTLKEAHEGWDKVTDPIRSLG
jgi:hypothetical protein